MPAVSMKSNVRLLYGYLPVLPLNPMRSRCTSAEAKLYLEVGKVTICPHFRKIRPTGFSNKVVHYSPPKYFSDKKSRNTIRSQNMNSSRGLEFIF